MSQSGQNVVVAFDVEGTYNTAPGTGSGTRFRLNPSPGLSMGRPAITPGEIRGDQQAPQTRLGSRTVSGTYSGDLSADVGFDIAWEAIMRSTWVAAVAIATAEVTSIAITGSNLITGTSGDWIAEGLRVGDVFRLTASAVGANDNINLIVLSLTTTAITCYGNGSATPLTDDAGPDTAYTLTILKKLSNGTAAPTKRTFYVEEVYQDIDESLVFGGCKFGSCTLRGTPDGMAVIEFGLVGASQTRLQSGDSPYYIAPTLGTNPGLVFIDAQILLDSVALTSATAFDLSINLNASTLPIIGAVVSPDIFDNTMRVTGSLSILRADLARVEQFDAETTSELTILLEEATGTPKKCVNFFIPVLKFTGADAPLGEEGAMVETLPWSASVRAAAAGYDAGTMTIGTET